MYNSLSYKKLLEEAFQHLQGAVQWSHYPSPSWSENVTSRLHKAEALIELVEAADCGSHGGFGIGQPATSQYTLYGRWNWLYEKYVGVTNKPNGVTAVKRFFERKKC